MLKDYHVIAEPKEQNSRAVSASTDSRSRAIWFFTLMSEGENWKRVEVRHQGKSYGKEEMERLP